jgi:hypothetical protein
VGRDKRPAENDDQGPPQPVPQLAAVVEVQVNYCLKT